MLNSINPTNNQKIKSYIEYSNSQVEEIISSVHSEFLNTLRLVLVIKSNYITNHIMSMFLL